MLLTAPVPFKRDDRTKKGNSEGNTEFMQVFRLSDAAFDVYFGKITIKRAKKVIKRGTKNPLEKTPLKAFIKSPRQFI